MANNTTYLYNKDLKITKPGWTGNKNYKGEFVNLFFHSKPGFGNILKWRLSPNPQRKEKRQENWDPEIIPFLQLPHSQEDLLVWLGHNSFYLQLAGKKILLDPVFGHIPFVKRQSKCPADPEIFQGIDYLLISHDHFDHLDKKSVKLIFRNNPNITVFCGLETGELFRKWCPGISVIEAGWYQQLEQNGLKITFLPSQHWGKRSAKDGGKRLWGAFLIEGNNKKIYYSGDTGYSGHFEEIKTLYGAPDYALVGIGAYKPRWFMQPNHISPQEALTASSEMEAGVTIPMHYGTFDLSDEPLSDPPEVFREEAMKRNIDIYVPQLGEVFSLRKKKEK